MTRQEFIDEVTNWTELVDFARENEMWDLIDDILDDEELNYDVDEALRGTRTENWWEIRDLLEMIPRYTDWYRRTGWLEYEPLDEDDFYEIKQNILDEADDNGCWDDEDSDEGDDGTNSDDALDKECDTAVVVSVLFGTKDSIVSTPA